MKGEIWLLFTYITGFLEALSELTYSWESSASEVPNPIFAVYQVPLEFSRSIARTWTSLTEEEEGCVNQYSTTLFCPLAASSNHNRATAEQVLGLGFTGQLLNEWGCHYEWRDWRLSIPTRPLKIIYIHAAFVVVAINSDQKLPAESRWHPF